MKRKFFIMVLACLFIVISAAVLASACDPQANLENPDTRPPTYGDPVPLFGRFLRFFEDELRIDQDDFILLTDTGNFNWWWERSGTTVADAIGGRILMMEHSLGFALVQTGTTLIGGTEHIFTSAMFSDLELRRQIMTLDGALYIHEDAFYQLRFEGEYVQTIGNVVRYVRRTQLRSDNELVNPVPTRAGYTFAGWRADAALVVPFPFGGTLPAELIVNNSHVYLFASWVPRYAVPTGMHAYLGQTLSQVSLPSDWEWVLDAQQFVELGYNNFVAIHIYYGILRYMVVYVRQMQYTVPTISDQVFYEGRTLSEIFLPQGWMWENPNEYVGNATGGYARSAYIIYSREGHAGIRRVVQIRVNRATRYSMPEAKTAIFGQTLQDVALDTGWEWIADTSTPVGNAGVRLHLARYTPIDLTNFNVVDRLLSIDVVKANPNTVTPTIAVQTFSATAVLTNIELPDRWRWRSSNTLVGTVGTNFHYAEYLPLDQQNYNILLISLPIQVVRAYNYVIPTHLHAVFGDNLSLVDLPRGWEWVSPGITLVGSAGQNYHLARYIPMDTHNYNIAIKMLPIQVLRANPNPVLPIIPSQLFYPKNVLSLIQLGLGWEWQSPNAFMGNAGLQMHTAIYTPADQENFNVAELILSIEIRPRPLIIRANPVVRQFGLPNPSFSIQQILCFVGSDNQFNSIRGNFDFLSNAMQYSYVGYYSISVTLGSAELLNDNYYFYFVASTLSIVPAILTIRANNTHRTFGADNPTFSASITGLRLNDTRSVIIGSYSFDTQATQSSNVGFYRINIAQGTASATNYILHFYHGYLEIIPIRATTPPAHFFVSYVTGQRLRDLDNNLFNMGYWNWLDPYQLIGLGDRMPFQIRFGYEDGNWEFEISTLYIYSRITHLSFGHWGDFEGYSIHENIRSLSISLYGFVGPSVLTVPAHIEELSLIGINNDTRVLNLRINILSRLNALNLNLENVSIMAEQGAAITASGNGMLNITAIRGNNSIRGANGVDLSTDAAARNAAAAIAAANINIKAHAFSSLTIIGGNGGIGPNPPNVTGVATLRPGGHGGAGIQSSGTVYVSVIADGVVNIRGGNGGRGGTTTHHGATNSRYFRHGGRGGDGGHGIIAVGQTTIRGGDIVVRGGNAGNGGNGFELLDIMGHQGGDGGDGGNGGHGIQSVVLPNVLSEGQVIQGDRGLGGARGRSTWALASVDGVDGNHGHRLANMQNIPW